MNQVSSPLKKFGIFHKLSGFLICAFAALISLLLGFIVPFIWIFTFFAVGGMTMCIGYRASGDCPLCGESMEVAKKRGGVRCSGCRSSLVVQGGRLWPVGQVNPAVYETHAPRRQTSPVAAGCLLVIIIIGLAISIFSSLDRDGNPNGGGELIPSVPPPVAQQQPFVEQMQNEDTWPEQEGVPTAEQPKSVTDTVSSKDEPEQATAFRENKAASKVKMAKLLLNEKDNSVAKKRLQEVVDDYPETESAKEAKGLLEKL